MSAAPLRGKSGRHASVADVWLDRGKLDRLLAQEVPAGVAGDGGVPKKSRRRGSVLLELFELGG
jgi:hypothetical protein